MPSIVAKIKHLSLSAVLLPALILMAAGVARAASGDEVESYKFDIGAGFGMSGYLGDANTSNVFKHPGVTFNGSFRYLIDNRWAIRGLLTAARLSGDTADWDDVLPDNASYSFNSWVYDLGARVEFNFFNYGIGETYKQLRRVTPYMALGLGGVMSSTGGKSYFALSLPMSVGVKYKIRPRLNLALEFTMAKAFGDHLDSPDLSDLYQIKSSFFKNTDWYSTLSISISYEFGPRCVVCNRLD